ncbi:MAG: 6-bladed beta-propeller [Candidatus Binatia bacterium]
MAALLVAGCAQPNPREAAEAPPTPAAKLVWPPPPDTAKIEYVTSITGTGDLHVAKSFFRRLGELILGPTEEWLVRPTGVAARDDFLAIADAGTPALFLIDRAARAFHKITQAGEEDLVSPVGVAIAGENVVYLSDSYLRRLYRLDREGRLLHAWGGDDLARPTSLAYDTQRRRLYVADAGAHRVLAYDPDGTLLFAFGERGLADAEFNWPSHLCVDRDGLIYVVDFFNFRVQIFDPDGHFLFTFGHQGDGSGDFSRPKGIGVDTRGHIYVVDALFDAVQIFDYRGRFLLGFGKQGRDAGEFWLPNGLATDRDRIYVADAYNQRVQVFRFIGAEE